MNDLQKRLLLLPFLPLLRSVENPSTPLSNPASWLTNLFGLPTASGQIVNSETALSLPAVWRAVWLNSSTIASLPLKVFEKKDNNRQHLSNHPVEFLLQRKANKYMTAFIWRQLSMLHVQFWGNAYSLINYDNKLRANELLPFHPSEVEPIISDKTGNLWYRFQTEKESFTVAAVHVLHLKGISFDGLKGKSALQVERENLGLALAAQKFGADFYQKGAHLDGVVEAPGALSETGLKNLRESWEETYIKGGTRTAILDMDMKYKQIGIPPNDAQFIETRKFSVTDVARIFGIPPPLLFDLEKATYANVAKLVQGYEKFDLNPWLINIEQEINDKLFLESEKNIIFVKHSLEGLLRGDMKERVNYYKGLFQIGMLSSNEGRRKENMNDYENGNKKYILANLLPVNGEKKPNNGT